MSSLYVRNLVRGWCENTAGLLLPFYDTVNREQNPAEEAWSTLLFMTAQALTITYCGHMEERGSFDFLALGRPGVGDALLLEAAEHDAAILLQQVDPQGHLVLLRAGVPEDFLQATAVPWYSVAITFDYYCTQPLPVTA